MRARQRVVVVQDHPVDVAEQGAQGGAVHGDRPGSPELDRFAVVGHAGVEAALALDAGGQGIGRLLLPVGQEHLARALQAGEPAHHLPRVGVAGHPLEVRHLGQHRDVSLVDPHRARPVQQAPPQGAHGLVAGDEQGVLGVGQADPAVVEDAASGEHAARGDDDRRALQLVQGLRLRPRAVQVHPLVVEQAPAPDAHQAHPVRVLVLRVDPGGVDGHGAVEVDREGSHAPLGHDLVHQVDHLLGAAHREGGDHEHAAPGEGALEHRFELLVHVHRGMGAVAVGALRDHVVGLRAGLGVLGEHRFVAADVAAEDHARGLAPLAHRHLHEGRAQQVAGVAVAEGEGVAHRLVLPEGHHPEELQARLHVGGVVEGQGGLVLGELLAVQVLGVLHLQVGGVHEQDLREVAGGRGAEDVAPEALLDQPRHAPDVVDVGVGEDEGPDLPRVVGRLRPVPQAQLLQALEHPAVHEQAFPARLQEVLRAGDRPRRA